MKEDPEAKRERWKSSLQKVQNELWIDPPLPSHLYHYSTLDAVRNILTKQEIWLSDIGSVRGDAYDGRYWIKVFRPIINRKSVPNYVTDLFQRTDSFGLGSLWYSYIACFSAESELEYQWEHYADDRTGCAIEIPFDSLARRCDDGKAYAWLPMVYDAEEQMEKAEKIIDAAIMLTRGESMTASELRDYWIRYASFSFLLCGMRFKEPQFCPEREWRVEMTKTDLTGVQYRPRGSESIAYRTLPLAPEMVTGVIKGSACACPDADLIELLNKGRYRANIRTHRSADSATSRPELMSTFAKP